MTSSKEVDQQFGTFPQAQLKGAALDRYWEHEREFAKCLANIPVRRDIPTGNGSVAAADVSPVFWMAEIPLDDPTFTLLDAANLMNDQMFAKEAAKNALLQKAIDERLGYYTFEQEADNMSVQWLARLGIDPNHAVHEWFILNKFYSATQQVSPYNFGFDRCWSLYNGSPRWTDNGQDVVIPIGSFADPHHGTCYRIYNLDKEIETHQYTIHDDRLPRALQHGGDWALRRKDIIALHDTKFPDRERMDNITLETGAFINLMISSPRYLFAYSD